jgi:hypothetical protein
MDTPGRYQRAVAARPGNGDGAASFDPDAERRRKALDLIRETFGLHILRVERRYLPAGRSADRIEWPDGRVTGPPEYLLVLPTGRVRLGQVHRWRTYRTFFARVHVHYPDLPEMRPEVFSALFRALLRVAVDVDH